MRYLISFMVVLALALMPAMASASDCDCTTNNCTYTIYAATDASPDLPADQPGDPIPKGLNNAVDWRWDFVRTLLKKDSNSINATIDGTNVDETIESSVDAGPHCIFGTGTINDDCQSHMVRSSGKSGYFTALYFRYLMYVE